MSFAMAYAAQRVPYYMLIKETVLLVIVFSQLVDGMMARYHLAIQLSRDENHSVLNNLLVLSSTYGGAELGSIMGVDVTTNRNKLFRVLEKHMSRFFISDKNKLSNSYRIRAKEEQRQFFLKLEKHNYLEESKTKKSYIIYTANEKRSSA